LTQVFFISFLINLFFSISSFNIRLMGELDFIIYFGLLSIRLSWSHDHDCEFDKLIQIDSDRFNILLSQYFKKMSSWIFLDKLHFYIKYWYNIFLKKLFLTPTYQNNLKTLRKNLKRKKNRKKTLYHHKNKWGINFLSLQHCACSKNYKNFFKNIFFLLIFFSLFSTILYLIRAC
jgi:hypothetical protein